MAALSVTTALSTLKTLFNDVQEIYYSSNEITSNMLKGASLAMTMELPAIDGDVTIDTGSTDVTRIKITTGANWTSKSTKGDPDISFQVASIAGAVNELFMNKVAEVTAGEWTLDGTTYKGAGYSTATKKVTGSLVLPSEDRKAIIVFPSVEMYSSFVAADGDKPAYFNVQVTPVLNSEGVDLFILEAND